MILAVLFLLTACTQPIPANTGVAGQVFIGPTCPVVQVNNPCPDKPYQASLAILTSSGRKVTQFTTAADGTFALPLAPGSYILHPLTPQNRPMPFGRDQPFSVNQGQFTQVKITYDSGIR